MAATFVSFRVFGCLGSGWSKKRRRFFFGKLLSASFVRMGRVWVVLRRAKAVGEVVLLVVAVLKWRRAFEASFLPGQKMSRLFRL